MELLLGAEANLEMTTPDGNTALHICAYASANACAKLLINARCRPDVLNHEGYLPHQVSQPCVMRWMDGWMGGWVDGWMGAGPVTMGAIDSHARERMREGGGDV